MIGANLQLVPDISKSLLTTMISLKPRNCNRCTKIIVGDVGDEWLIRITFPTFYCLYLHKSRYLAMLMYFTPKILNSLFNNIVP